MLALILSLWASLTASPAAALDAAVADMCDRNVVLLGEPANHGDAGAITLKTDIVRRLLDDCGFDALFVEASFYDFLELERRRDRGDAVTRAQVSSAIGGIWNRWVEGQPLIELIHDRFSTGRLRIGGIDDQLGSAGAIYSLEAMPAELSSALPARLAAACRQTLRGHILGETGDDAAKRAAVGDCLDAVDVALRRAMPRNDRAVRRAMLAGYRRAFSRDMLPRTALGAARDAAMWANFRWLHRRLPRGSKVIVWTATVHAARAPTPGREAPFGQHLAAAFGPRSFALALGAAGGHYAEGGSRREIVHPSPGSLEAVAVAGSAAAATYLDRGALARIGTVPSTMLDHEPVTANWSQIVDGVIVLRTERAPVRLPR